MTTKLEKLLRFGFSTASLCAGGDEHAQCPKWLCQRQQGVLLDQLKAFSIETAKIEADPNLSAAGKVGRRRELAMGLLNRLKGEEGHKMIGYIRTKLGAARDQLAAAEKPANESDTAALTRLMRMQFAAQFLRDMPGAELLAELRRAVRTRDVEMFTAITSIPRVVLVGKGLTDSTVDSEVQRWRETMNPALAQAIADGETMLQLAEENLQAVVSAVEEAGGIETRSVEIKK